MLPAAAAAPASPPECAGGARGSGDGPGPDVELIAAPPPPELTATSVAKSDGVDMEHVSVRLLPHEGLVFLDRPRGRPATYLHHTQTRERVALGPHPWKLIFDEHGFGALYQEGSEEVVLVEDLLKSRYCERGPWKDVVVVQRPNGKQHHWRVSERMHVHEEIKVHYRIGPTLTATQHTCYVFSMSRQTLNNVQILM